MVRLTSSHSPPRKKAHGRAVWVINRKRKLIDPMPSVLVLQKEEKEGKKDKDSDKEDEDAGKWDGR